MIVNSLIDRVVISFLLISRELLFHLSLPNVTEHSTVGYIQTEKKSRPHDAGGI